MKHCSPATLEAQFATIERMQKDLGRLIACAAETARVAAMPRPKRVAKKR